MLLFLPALLFGCVSATPQSGRLLSQRADFPKNTKIDGVPFLQQSTNYCGPATLAMAMNWAGKKVSLEEIAPQVYTPGMKGTLQSDMIGASRRQGLMAVPISGMKDLLREVSAGNPVIVFENLSVSWLPQWHYAIVFGYDLSQEKVLMHSGPEAFKQWDLRKFERSWKLGEYWGLVVLPPGKLSVSGDELKHVKAAAALEQLGKTQEADLAYQAILGRWPKSLAPLIGRANIAFAKKDYTEAMGFLNQARTFHPANAVVWHNLAIAQGAAQMKTQARKTATQALRLVSAEEKDLYMNNLKNWLTPH